MTSAGTDDTGSTPDARDPGRGVSRRQLLVASLGAGLAACTGGTDRADTGSIPAVRPTRRTTTTVAASTSTASPTSTVAVETTSTVGTPSVTLPENPFRLGVASGEPDMTSVVLWTHLSGVLPDEGIDVVWWFESESGGRVEGTVRATPDGGGAVHVIAPVDGPGRFGFAAGGHESDTGRTAPLPSDPESFRFAAASCQNYETGFYAAHRDIAEWRPDLVVFLGDFIYENPPFPIEGVSVREHDIEEPFDLGGYRRRYSTYLSDPQLRAARAAAPWLTIWDDHEVQNNYAALVSSDERPIDEFGRRRAAAYRAWWEHTATRLPPPGDVGPYRTWRALDVGDLVSFSALDGRQFRSDQLSEQKGLPGPPLAGWDDPSRTVLGLEQEQWVAERFRASRSVWHCLAQPVMMTDARDPATGNISNYDGWDGYDPARRRLLEEAPDGLVVVSGDVHHAAVGALGAPESRAGVEFVTTAVSSIPNLDPELEEDFVSLPDIVDAELSGRGYTRHTLDSESWTAEFRVVDDVADADSTVSTWKQFAVSAGSTAVENVDL